MQVQILRQHLALKWLEIWRLVHSFLNYNDVATLFCFFLNQDANKWECHEVHACNLNPSNLKAWDYSQTSTPFTQNTSNVRKSGKPLVWWMRPTAILQNFLLEVNLSNMRSTAWPQTKPSEPLKVTWPCTNSASAQQCQWIAMYRFYKIVQAYDSWGWSNSITSNLQWRFASVMEQDTLSVVCVQSEVGRSETYCVYEKISDAFVQTAAQAS